MAYIKSKIFDLLLKYSKKWQNLIKENPIFDAVDSGLRGYGQVLFCNNSFIGALFLLITFTNPVAGFTGFLGSIFATATAYALQPPESYLKSGLFSLNGALIGIAWGVYLEPSFHLILLLFLTTSLSALLTLVLITSLGKNYDLPSLSISFVLMAWIGFLTIPGISGLSLKPNPFEIKYTGMEKYLLESLPWWISFIFRSIASIFFQNSIIAGILFFAGLLYYSRTSALFAAGGGLLGALILKALGYSNHVPFYLIGFNCILAALAFGGFFLVLNRNSIIYCTLAVIFSSLVSLAIDSLLLPLKVPVLAASFNLTVLLFLYPVKSGVIDEDLTDLRPVPLNVVKSPEESLNWYKKKMSEKKALDLRLPFFGTWLVCQGNNGSITHRSLNKFAWDFVIVDEERCPFKEKGEKVQDYYSFGLPVIAPSSGTVIKVVNDIPDNEPNKENHDDNWGNYVIIEHETGEYSEISHLKQNSIIVSKSAEVAAGQIIGCCGNSGRSPIPHIHYQLQKNGFAGARTIPAVFCNFIKLNSGKEELVLKGKPQEGDFVKNYENSFLNKF